MIRFKTSITDQRDLHGLEEGLSVGERHGEHPRVAANKDGVQNVRHVNFEMRLLYVARTGWPFRAA